MRHLLILAAVVLLFSNSIIGQSKIKLEPKQNSTPINPETIGPVKEFRPLVPSSESIFLRKNRFEPIHNLPKPIEGQSQLQAYISSETGTPYFIKGKFDIGADKQASSYFKAIESVLKLNNAGEELQLIKVDSDENTDTEHFLFQQTWKGVPVYGAEAKLHIKNTEVYLFNGRFFPSPRLEDVSPEISKESAESISLEEVAKVTQVRTLTDLEKSLITSEQAQAELVIYHPGKKIGAERLAWHVTVVPNITHRYSYFIDAKTGGVLNSFSELCQIAGHWKEGHHNCGSHIDEAATYQNAPDEILLDGPATANAPDLFGISRLINTYEVGNAFFLIDASRAMFNFSQSSLPDDPSGAIWTIDGQNGSPENNDFQVSNVFSSNNNWNNNPIAVSAHYNGGLAYEYFKNTFGRESINGQGGNIISLINITESDGQQMDNAFWNGAAMFYGNGDVAFDQPLAKSPDVAGHEMSHGVVQATANLEYIGESGALNESFADVFGAMIDRDDWKIGEDISNDNIFPTGALRDMENPNNGGTDFNDNGYQPDHYNDRFTGSQDNGGVHINSGIPNKAFYLFATAIGKEKAEQVYYRALSMYLFKSAQFVDCRIAVEQAASDLYGSTEVAAVQNAFAAVGIGAGAGTDSQTDTDENPGEDFILMTDEAYDWLYIYTPDGSEVAEPLSTVSPLSRPSITDDGSSIVYIATDNTMRAINIDWQASTVDPITIQSDPIWRNVAVSKDGQHLAALTTDNDNQLWIYDYNLAQWQTFELFNPTTGQGGPTTGDVLYADVLEWDITGEWVMYDALNRINTTGSQPIEYWDISFVNVWDNDIQNFSAGYTSKLFNGLPEDISVGNPTFSKNSDYIIAFDYIDDFNQEYYLRAANIETGELSTIFQNGGLSWPSYATDDSQLVFDANDNFGTPVLAFAPLADDKISANGSPFVYLNNRRWGVWFANGERILTSTDEAAPENNLTLFPNPVSGELTIKWTADSAGEATIQVFDLFGKKVKMETLKTSIGEVVWTMDLSNLLGGQYFIHISQGAFNTGLKVIKL